MRDLDVELHAVRGALTVIRSQCFSMNRRGKVAEASLIDAEIDRIVEVINGIAGRPACTNADPVRARSVVAEVVLRHLAAAETRGVSLRLVGGVHDICLSEGGSQLGLALDNLVQNAIRHCDDGGEVVVALVITRHGARITVFNDGPSPSPVDLRAIFEVGERGREPRGEGWGLGLAIASREVGACGGSITARPVDGGCVFEIDLAGEAVPA